MAAASVALAAVRRARGRVVGTRQPARGHLPRAARRLDLRPVGAAASKTCSPSRPTLRSWRFRLPSLPARSSRSRCALPAPGGGWSRGPCWRSSLAACPPDRHRSLCASRPRPAARAARAHRALSKLAERARVPVAGIDEWMVADASPATAIVTGVGPTRRVLLSSEIVRRLVRRRDRRRRRARAGAPRLSRPVADVCAHVAVFWASLFAAHLAVDAACRRGLGPGDLAALPLVALVAVRHLARSPRRCVTRSPAGMSGGPISLRWR